jgi:hypothetical protein
LAFGIVGWIRLSFGSRSDLRITEAAVLEERRRILGATRDGRRRAGIRGGRRQA